VAQGQVMAARRGGTKAPMKVGGLAGGVGAVLDELQAALLAAARERRETHSIRGAPKDRFLAFLKDTGGFAYAGFCGSGECEASIKAETGATVRVLPDPEFRSPEVPRTCVWCGRPSVAEAVWGQAY